MRLQLEQIRQHERLTKQLQKRLLVGALVQIAHSLVEKVEAALARLEHVVVSADVQLDCSAEMTVIAIVHHLPTDTQVNTASLSRFHAP